MGITSREDPNIRWKDGKGYSEKSRFHSAIIKYGWNNFDHIILLHAVDEDTAKKVEVALIAKWNTQDKRYGYNMTSGGDGTPGCYPSNETMVKLSNARRKENLSAETLQKRSDSLRGRKFTDEHKRKIGDGNSKSINMLSRDGQYIKTFRGARDAEIELGISHSHISQCCHGHRKTAGGYVWEFVQ